MEPSPPPPLAAGSDGSDGAAGSDGPVAALDPGRGKCGLVLCDPARLRVLAAHVLPPPATGELLRRWHRELGLEQLVLGGGTGSAAWRRELRGAFRVVVVDERGTTLAARRRYWQLHPPRLWGRLLPEGLRLPPRDIDDVAAQILLERWLGRTLPRDPGAEACLRTPPGP